MRSWRPTWARACCTAIPQCVADPDGCLLVDRSAALIAGLDDAKQQLLDRRCEPTGVLRMTAPSVLGRMVLTPLLGQLLQQHPACRSRPASPTAWWTWWTRV
ncbi:hypothetical protein [Comamonas sp. JC664]|uniref:hypothetical protein n=1 Tax=Comamonas sp. JC664 TaxID=2801917 RepID=UPI00360CE417